MTEQLTAVFDHIATNRQGFIDRLLAYVSRPSISAHGVGIAETADFLLGYLGELGFQAQLLPRLFVMGMPTAFVFIPLAVWILGKGRADPEISPQPAPSMPLRPPTQQVAASFHAQVLAATQGQLAEGAFALAWRRGRSLRPDALAALALGCSAGPHPDPS